MDKVMEERETDNLLVNIMQGLFRSYSDDPEEREELVRNLRRLADHIEAGGPRPTNVYLGSTTGYCVR